MKLYLLVTIDVMVMLSMALTASVGKPGCGAASSSKNIQLLNPKIPPRECTYKINAYSSYVCQLRIEMTYTLAEPSIPTAQNGLEYVECDTDYFQAGDLKLCGVENYQHIYLPFNRTAGVTSLNLKVVLAHRVASQNLPTPKWSIMVTQLECPAGASVRSVEPIETKLGSSTPKDGFFVAPPGCLQYYPESEGTITSFNYQHGEGIYPGNLNYAICFRRSSDTKSLVLKNNFFRMGSNGSEDENTDEYCYAGDKSQAWDYLLIPQAVVENTAHKASYFCGDSINAETIISTNPGPLMIIFNSAGLSSKKSGFSFNYQVISK